MDSALGEGTTFSIYLPAFSAEEATAFGAEVASIGIEAPDNGADLTGEATVLLVEDEDAVRVFGSRALRNKGYRVLEAVDGEEALDVINDFDQTIDLIITDVMMPGVDGPALLQIVRNDEWLRDMPVVMMSANEHSETVYLTVVDKDRNAVSLIESIFGNFGSRIVPGDLGFALQNRASGFSLEEGHLNSLEPHKRSLHTNMPGFITQNGRPIMPFGVMGGHMQPQGHVQVLLNMIDFGMNVQEAGDAARVRHGSVLAVEPGISDAVIAELERRGHTVERAGGGGMGGYQAIQIDPDTGMLHGGTDPRKDGQVVGY